MTPTRMVARRFFAVMCLAPAPALLAIACGTSGNTDQTPPVVRHHAGTTSSGGGSQGKGGGSSSTGGASSSNGGSAITIGAGNGQGATSGGSGGSDPNKGQGLCETVAQCDDGDSCTTDTCDKKPGGGEFSESFCNHSALADGTSCDDGNACTTGDTCHAGACTGVANPCDDQNPCTTDACTNGKCGSSAAGDGTVCGTATGAGTCSAGVCTLASMCAVSCDDMNPCTTDACDANGQCQHMPATDGTTCDDGDACTVGEVCAQGNCAGPPKNCDDGNGCTDDSCAGGVCAHPPSGDGTVCMTSGLTGVCKSQTCDVGCAGNCDDGDACTTDMCTAGACTHGPAEDGTGCDDSNMCTSADACSGGVCVGTADPTCGVSPINDATCVTGCAMGTAVFPPAVAIQKPNLPASCGNGFEVNNPPTQTFTLTAKTPAGSQALNLDVEIATYTAPDHIRVTGIDGTGATYVLVDTCTVRTATYSDPTNGCTAPPADSIRQFSVPLKAGTKSITFDYTGACTPTYTKMLGLCDFDIVPFEATCGFRPLP